MPYVYNAKKDQVEVFCWKCGKNITNHHKHYPGPGCCGCEGAPLGKIKK